MRYTVLTLTGLDRLASLQRCLAKIRAGAHYQDYEIVVVNNGSQDGTSEYLQDLASVKSSPLLRAVHRPENEGVCARNYGIEIAQGDVIIQVDDDVLVSPGFDRVLLEPYSRPEVGATGQHGFYQDSTWGLLIDDRRRPGVGQYTDLVMGFCWSWRNAKEAETQQYFTERSPGQAEVLYKRSPCFLYDWDFSPFWHEESDLQCQIRAAGYRLMVTRPVASHQTRHDWKETMADGPITGESIARRNFWKLVDKWQDKDIRFEGPAVGLRGPAPGRRPTR